MTGPADVLVIGAGSSGLVAAAYLAKAGARVIALEAEAEPGGSCAKTLTLGGTLWPVADHTMYALDPRVVKDLKLTRRGLKFAVRDLDLVSLRGDERPLVLGRDAHAAKHVLAQASERDSERYTEVRRDLFAFARAMRAMWWDDGVMRAQDELRRFAATSACDFLEAAFEAEVLKSAFLFDALAGGAAPSEAGSSLLLAWRAAQEMCGLQGAVALPHGGMSELAGSFREAARAAGAEIRTNASVAQVSVKDHAAAGVVLASGEEIPARVVLSSLSRRRTLLDLAPTGAAGFATSRPLRKAGAVGEAKLVFTLKAVPGFVLKQPGARYIITERFESCAAAHAEARAGRLPKDLALEAVMPTALDPDSAAARTHILSVLARPVPVVPAEAWPQLEAELVEAVTDALERVAPGFKGTITAQAVAGPKTSGCEPVTVSRMLAGWKARIVSPIDGLLLCGETAEPVPAISGRAARLAAAMAAARLKGGKR